MKKNQFNTFTLFIFTFLISMNLTSLTHSSEPTLTLETKGGKKNYTQSELLSHPKMETITLNKTPAYEMKLKFKAIKASELFRNIKIEDNAVIQFKALDGFAAPISKERILNTSPKKSIAYIAIEDPKNKWPVIPKFKSSAGPFYLIWKNPELSQIDHGEWPLMLASFEVKGTLESLYPAIFPDPKLDSKNPIQKGFILYNKNCFSCHTMNKQGASQFGPDLNLPMNPTEYMTESSLRKLIRDPQSVRFWPLSRMIAFPKSDISEKELDAIIAYLKHMAKRKI